MKSLTKYLIFNTKEKIEFVNITSQVEDVIHESGIKEGGANFLRRIRW